MLAKEIMRRQIVTVSPGMTLRELAEVLSNRHITGAPVVDAQGRLVGVVSQTDLARHQARFGYAPFEGKAGVAVGAISPPEPTRVFDVMSRPVVSFDENTTVKELAREFLRRRIHRAVITSNGRFNGIVTSMDLLRVLAQTPETQPQDAEDPFTNYYQDLGGCGE